MKVKVKGNKIMKKNYEGKYCVIRGDRSGVFAGNVEGRDGQEVLIKNVRRIWYWDGANSLSQLAKEGVKRPENCKFTVIVDEAEILDAIEIIPCTEESEANIKGVKEWKI